MSIPKMKKTSKNELIMVSNNLDKLYNNISKYIDTARQQIQNSVSTEMVNAYWLIGRDIVIEEQNGGNRAEYGRHIIKELSNQLNLKYGKGFSATSLKNARYFYLTYSDPIGQTVSAQFKQSLGWSHYELIMRVSRSEARQFYEIEADKNHWSVRELRRQIASLLFDRLAKSKDKKGLLRLACRGQELNNPVDAIKDPVVLEFLDIPETHKMVESKLEEALINNLQHFLLELGKGFAFVARQKRLTLDGKHFYTDLVFYSIPLKAYLIIDLKTHELTHADLGQILMYVNYFDQEIKLKNDNPTIGLILCTKKSNAMVKYCLGEKAKQIFASTYQFNLPTVEELEAELKKELAEIKEDLEYKKFRKKN